MKTKYLFSASIVAAFLVASSTIGVAFAHPHMVVTPDESDHEQMNANPVILTLGHSNEPAFGVNPGIHDGKHDFELSIEDAATTLPLAGANLTLDRYYFSDFRAFDRAMDVDAATVVDKGIQLRGVFGEPGVYSVRQIVTDGIYGYRVYGTIDYFGVAQIPIDSTVFCTTPAGNTSKFNSPGWEGSYGCIGDIESLVFPPNNGNMRRTTGENADATMQQASISGNTKSTESSNTFQILVPSLVGVGLASFFGIRKFGQRKRN